MTKNTTANSKINSNRHFPLFQSHLDLAKSQWESILLPGDTAVDATAGNGHDALFLAKAILTPSSGHLHVFDVQDIALQETKKRILNHIPECEHRVNYHHASHVQFPAEFGSSNIKLFVYNLGYLPSANKSMTTETTSTLLSVQHASLLLSPGGLISITCYPGHPEGALEETALVEWASTLNKEEWSVCHHRWINRTRAPSLLLLQKNEVSKEAFKKSEQDPIEDQKFFENKKLGDAHH